MVKIKVRPSSSKSNVKSVQVDIEKVSPAQLKSIYKFFKKQLTDKSQSSEALANSFVFAIQTCPKANPSDIWQHIIYRSMIHMGFSDQQWKRISGFALEKAFIKIYQPRLEKYNLRIRCLPKNEIHDFLNRFNLSKKIKRDKIDCVIEQNKNGKWHLLAGLHIKASLAERIQDDVPASLALMTSGFLSIVITLDSKSYPPPHGDGINYGELGGITWDHNKSKDKKVRIKRQYIEVDGQFDALFSYNLRTPASPINTISGKRIFTLSFNQKQPDDVVSFLLEKATK